MYLQIFVGAGRRCCVCSFAWVCVFFSVFFRGEGLVLVSRWFLVNVPSS